ncbi:MAG: HAD family hydrolase [Dehalococcoidia bacterium]
MSRITAVTFDLWQTLLLDNRESGRARTQVRLEGARSALQKYGEPYDLAHLEEAYQSGNQQCRDIREEHLDISFREQVEIFIEHICSGLSRRLPESLFREIASAYADSFFVHPPLPHPDALPVLQGVKDLGLRIGMISNTGMTPGVTFRRFWSSTGCCRTSTCWSFPMK